MAPYLYRVFRMFSASGGPVRKTDSAAVWFEHYVDVRQSTLVQSAASRSVAISGVTKQHGVHRFYDDIIDNDGCIVKRVPCRGTRNALQILARIPLPLV